MPVVEVARILLLAAGGLTLVLLAVLPRLACRLYARAVAADDVRAAGLWAFLAAGSRGRGDYSDATARRSET
jgi:hypothetical protein